ncbi:MAG: ArsA-related P-loop ATPase [Actinomycetes bacterium]
MTQPGEDRPAGGVAKAPWAGVRLHVVTGKGGAGKTTVASALAIALAGSGRRVLLVEVEERQGLAQVLDVAPLSYEERPVATVPGGGKVLAMAVDPHEALMEYLALYTKIRRAGKTLERVGAVDFATTVAPGLRDVLLTGKIFEAVRRRAENGFVYDAVVVDAPPTGRITRFLGVSTDVAGLAKVGPIHRQAEAITTLFRSRRTVVHLVTLLEEMPAQETIEAVDALWRAKFPIGGIVINAGRAPMLSRKVVVAVREGAIDSESIGKELSSVGLDNEVTAQLLLDEGNDYAQRLVLERRARRMLHRLDRPIFDLPLIEGGVDVAGVHELAAELRAQGAA